MAEFPQTSESLIARVRDPSDHLAWAEFEQLYRPVIFRIARARGLQHVDAQDLAQLVLISVARAIGKYEQRSEGPRFRNWLSRITRNAILKAMSRAAHDQPLGGSGFLEVLLDLPEPDAEIDQLIEVEYRREQYRRAAQIVRKSVRTVTWQAFELTVLQEHSIEDAARQLELSTGSVYAARSRVMKKLRDAFMSFSQSESEESR